MKIFKVLALLGVVGFLLSAPPATAMNQEELVIAAATDAGVSKAEARKAINAFLEATGQALKKGDKVTLIGFGAFSVSSRGSRPGRDPTTGKPINIPARKTIKFKAGADLSAAVK